MHALLMPLQARLALAYTLILSMAGPLMGGTYQPRLHEHACTDCHRRLNPGRQGRKCPECRGLCPQAA